MSNGASTVADSTSLGLINTDANGQLYEQAVFNNAGDLFYIDPATSYLYSVANSGYIAFGVPNSGQSNFQFEPLAQIVDGSVPCTCSIADTTVPEGLSYNNALNCDCVGQNLYFINPTNGQPYLAIGSSRPGFATSPADYPTVVYV